MIKVDEVYTFKLSSGEEIVAKVREIVDTGIMIENPVSIAPTHQGMQLIPSVFTADVKDLVRLNTNSITMTAITDDSIKMKYLEATTGIKVPDKKLILG